MGAGGTVAFESLLERGDHGPTGVAALVGLEHEYRLSHDGGTVDFRDMIHGLAVPGKRLDPGDSNAYRCPSGLAITCDDEEAEVASPPLALAPGFTRRVDDWARAGRNLLGEVLPQGIGVGGYSTHLSAAMPDRYADRVLDLMARTFAPGLMMVLDGPDSHGVFLRPRPSRMELCGEYAIGTRLRAAAALFAGAARACADAVAADGRRGHPLPPALRVAARPAAGRYGLEIDRRRAFGFDLYTEGRRALLPVDQGGAITAQAHLELAWACARVALAGCAAPGDLDPMDRIVRRSSPLGIDAASETADAGDGRVSPTPFGALLARRHRGDFQVAPFLATWSFTVFSVHSTPRSRFVCIPRPHLGRFLDLLDAGMLDGALRAHARSPLGGRILTTYAQTQHPGLWDAVGDPIGLLPPERGADEAPAETATGTATGTATAKSHRLGPVSPAGAEPRATTSGHRAAGPTRPYEPRPGKPSTARTSLAPPPAGRDRTRAGPDPTQAGPPGAGPPGAGPRPGKPAAPRSTGPTIPRPEKARPTPAPGPTGAATADRPARSHQALVVLVALALAVLVGSAYASGAFGGRRERVVTSGARPTTTDARPDTPSTAPTEPPEPTAPETTSPGPGEVPTTLAPEPAVTEPTASPATVPGGTATPPPDATVPTAGPITTVADVTTTVPEVTTTVPAPTTTLPPPPAPTTISIGDGCTFSPASLTRPQGSIVRFQNQSPATVTVTGSGPAGTADVLFSLEPGSSSGPFVLSAAGAYSFLCRGGGTGQMAVTAT